MAEVDYFLKLDGISGDSADAKHKGEIDVLSFSFGETQAAAADGAGRSRAAGRVAMSDFSFVATTSSASPVLFLHCAEGRHIKQGTLTVRRSGEGSQEHLKIKLQDVLVSAYSMAGEASEGDPSDTFSLKFRRIAIDYQSQRPDGSLGAPVHGEWDLAANVKV
jgi:type VI secretion system secreted protein Hcp